MARQETLGESILEVTALLVSLAVSCATCVWVIKRDEKKLSEAMLERAYAPATFALSIFVFQQVAVLVHFVRTRRSFKGFLLGLGWAILAFVPSTLVDFLFGLFLPD